jgi:TetR/AcrR family transcriptional regulator, cholesterol catabolism regulator
VQRAEVLLMAGESQAADRRARRMESRRGLILDAAAAEFAEVGYERATLERIGDRVGLSKASVYYYVKDGKPQLLVDLVARVGEEVEARIAALTVDDASPVARLRAFLTAHVEVANTTPEGRLLSENLDELMSSESAAELRHRYERSLTAIIDDGVAAGQFQDLPRRPVVKLILGALNPVRMWHDPSGALSLEDITNVALSLLLTGLENR